MVREQLRMPPKREVRQRRDQRANPRFPGRRECSRGRRRWRRRGRGAVCAAPRLECLMLLWRSELRCPNRRSSVSVLVVVIVVTGARVRVFVFGFVEDRIADDVFFARPVAEVEEAAAFAAEREVGACFGVGWLMADGAAVLHGSSTKRNTNGFERELEGGNEREVWWRQERRATPCECVGGASRLQSGAT